MRKTLYDHCIEQGNTTLLREWHPTKNAPITVRDISYGSHKKVWWQCESGHQWEAAVYARSGSGSGCPYCAGKKALPFSRSLATEFPSLLAEWHPSKNIGISPQDILPATHRKVWWKCKKGHEWAAQVNSRTRGNGCPFCANRKVLVGENDLATTHPALALQWFYEKNGSLTPQTVVAGSRTKVWWQCTYGHQYQATILSRTNGSTGCPICAGKQVIPGETDLASAFPSIAAQWHTTKNGALTPDQVTVFSNRKVWWTCQNGHDYPAIIAQRTQSATDCPYCTGRKVMVGFNDLETLEPEVAAQWHPNLNGSLTAQMVTTGCHKKVWWQCGEGHVWKAVVYSRTSTKKCGCPVCAGKIKKRRML